jgi:hypothetical protein
VACDASSRVCVRVVREAGGESPAQRLVDDESGQQMVESDDAVDNGLLIAVGPAEQIRQFGQSVRHLLIVRRGAAGMGRAAQDRQHPTNSHHRQNSTAQHWMISTRDGPRGREVLCCSGSASGQ